MRISDFQVHDLRFPTSREKHGSDAMNPDPDYSCAYLQLLCGDEVIGNGLTFTIGRGNDLCVAAIEALIQRIKGISLDDFADDLGLVSERILSDSQYRWLGPEKGVVHLAAAAIINAVWDALSKNAGVPLWKYISTLPPERLVGAIDFTYISDFLSKDEALDRLKERAPGIPERSEILLKGGYPAYTTSAGWLGYSDEEIRRRIIAAHSEGWTHFKIKVGRDLEEDKRRCALFREILGTDVRLSVDANQVWDVDEAITWIRELAPYDLTWVEEPTSPDDILGHQAIARAVAPVGIATGEHAHNKVMFKQLLQAEAISYCQIDSCRLAGVNENLAVMMMADKAGVPVCPHAGGVGLCEYVQHLSMVDYLCISGDMEGRVIEHAGHLHHHFADPIVIDQGRYLAPSAPGYSVDLRPGTIEEFTYPGGTAWQANG